MLIFHFPEAIKHNFVLKFHTHCLEYSAANNYYPSASHHEKRNKKTTSQIQFSAVTVKEQIKPVFRQISTRRSDWQFCREIVVKSYLIFT